MVNLALGRDLAVTVTSCQHKDIHKITRRSPDNKICNQIDYTLVDRGQCTHVFDLRSMRGTEIKTDNFLFKVKIRLKIKVSEKTKKSKKKRNIGKQNRNEEKAKFIKKATANVQNPPYM
jgi:hypothetical protein